ncbi:MAG: site-specific DNA-methyltransferase [Anaeroplasma bactoclasticum]|nr:site-specific DNA-methyltransferase [Anaeroplasma bactoclasticum]
MLAFALRDELGFILRQDIIWYKPNPMPESVKDRFTKSHEYIFLFSKNPKYYFDQESIKEKALSIQAKDKRIGLGRLHYRGKRGETLGKAQANFVHINETRNKRSVWNVSVTHLKQAHFAIFPMKLIEPCILAGSRAGGIVLDPFCGSGTTGVVALEYGRDFIGIDINPEYCQMAKERIEEQKK